jgi:glycosyltransferase involved in cell wall biosynthesis
MRVLMVSTSYPRDAADWRGIFIRHLVGAFSRASGIELALWAPTGEVPEGVVLVPTAAESAWLAKLMQAGGISHRIRKSGASALLAALKLTRMLAAGYRRHTGVDIYHINWLQCALPLPRNGIPALISVLGNDLKLLRLPLMKTLLRRAMRGRRVAVCPNAEWMCAPLTAAFGDLAEVIPVSFGIDANWYAIKRTPQFDKPIWLAITRLTADKLGPLFEWSAPLFADGSRELHLFGPMQETIAIPDWIRYHGAATPDALARDWFPHAAGLVTLSEHAEGRPQVMLEAMAAGLPILASRLAAHIGLVSDGKTGHLCGSPETFSSALRNLENATTNQRFGEAARAWAEKEIGTWDDCANRYMQIYRGLIGDTAHA